MYRPKNCTNCGKNKYQLGGNNLLQIMNPQMINEATIDRPLPDAETPSIQMSPFQELISKGVIEAPQGWEGTAQQYYDHVNTPQKSDKIKDLQRLGIGLQGARTGLSWLAGAVERNRQNQFDMTQQTALGMMNPMQVDDFQPNPYNLYMMKGGKLTKIVKDYNKWSNDAGPMDMTHGEGNKYLQQGGRTPIYTNNPNDPKLRAYNDSLKLHVGSKKALNWAKSDFAPFADNGEAPVYYKYTKDDKKNILKQSIEDPSNAFYIRNGRDMRHLPFLESKTIRELGILPVGQFSNIDYSGGHGYVVSDYKKPVQPVVYKKPQDNWRVSEDEYNKKGIPLNEIDPKNVKIINGRKVYGTRLTDKPTDKEFGEPETEEQIERKLQKGGDKNKKPSERKPIITNDPKDPRLKAYNDSLKTFNLANLEQKNYYNGKSGVPVPFSKNPQFNSANEFIDSHYGEYTGNSYNRAKELNTVAKRARIKPYGQYTPPPNTGGIGDQYPAYFKKPVQPVVYQEFQEPEFKAPSKMDGNRPDLRGIPFNPNISDPNLQRADWDMSKPSNWSITSPTGPYNEQETLNLPDEATWRAALEGYKNISTQQMDGKGTATGYKRLKYGGNLKNYQAGGKLGQAAGKAFVPKNLMVTNNALDPRLFAYQDSVNYYDLDQDLMKADYRRQLIAYESALRNQLPTDNPEYNKANAEYKDAEMSYGTYIPLSSVPNDPVLTGKNNSLMLMLDEKRKPNLIPFEDFEHVAPKQPIVYRPKKKKGGYEIDRMLVVRKLLPELLNLGRLGTRKYRGHGMKKGGTLTPNKAREILHDGTAHGQPLTDKQRKFFGAKSKGHTNYRGK